MFPAQKKTKKTQTQPTTTENRATGQGPSLAASKCSSSQGTRNPQSRSGGSSLSGELGNLGQVIPLPQFPQF